MQYDQRFLQEHVEDLKQLNKKYKNKGLAIYTIRRRVFNSAMSILALIEPIPFADLSWDLYFLIENTDFSVLANGYKGVLETAKVQPKKFIQQLYEFYRKTGKKIKEQGLTRQFFTFLSLLMSYSDDDLIKRERPIEHNVYVAYLNLLLEQAEFLRSNIFDHDKVVAGIDTHGNVMEITDFAPNADAFGSAIEDALTLKDQDICTQAIYVAEQKYGIKVADFELLLLQCQNYDNNIYAMVQYINEYTMDIVVNNDEAMSADVEPIIHVVPVSGIPIDVKQLTRKRRTLPTNGLKITIGNNTFIQKMLLKEIVDSGEVVVLYKAYTALGAFSGFYRQSDDVFYSIFGHTNNKIGNVLNDVVKNIVLWGYTSYVCHDTIEIDTVHYLQYFDDNVNNPDVSYVSKNGKLHIPSSGVPRQLIAYQDGYETEVKYITGYIRKLPIGQTASPQAIDTARALGYELAPNETYVCPFERNVWIRKK